MSVFVVVVGVSGLLSHNSLDQDMGSLLPAWSFNKWPFLHITAPAASFISPRRPCSSKISKRARNNAKKFRLLPAPGSGKSPDCM